MRTKTTAFAAGLIMAFGSTTPRFAAAEEREDTLPAVRSGVVELLNQGYRVAHYELERNGEGRMILRRKYSVVLCQVDENGGGDELELESACFRLR